MCLHFMFCVLATVLFTVREARLKEIRTEILNSEKLKVCTTYV